MSWRLNCESHESKVGIISLIPAYIRTFKLHFYLPEFDRHSPRPFFSFVTLSNNLGIKVPGVSVVVCGLQPWRLIFTPALLLDKMS